MKQFFIDAFSEENGGRSFRCTPSFMARSAFFYVQSAGHFYCSPKYYTKREGYRSYLLIYTIKGKGYARYRGRQYTLEKGQVLLMDCYDYQEYYSDPKDLWEIEWVHFSGSTSEAYFKTIYDHFGPVVDMGGNTTIQEALEEILEMLSRGDFQFEVKASPIIVRILTEVILAASKIGGVVESGQRVPQVEAAIRFIDNNYSLGITLTDIAKAAYSSPFYLARLFKKTTGYSPYEYLLKYRINKAKTLLITTEQPVDSIAEAVGFKSTSNFVKTFKTLEDMTPLKYRKYWVG